MKGPTVYSMNMRICGTNIKLLIFFIVLLVD